ncbi:mercuric ion transporter MerT [Polaromonas sp.]|uniref:mercuric ion transporter MerT n=1 Tax=Polaromonas sp. TaxID=1869339 RepID=UPI003751C89B
MTPLALIAGGVAAFLASACCLGPLVLLLLGFSGAWIGNLAALEPFRPLFVAVAGVALYIAGRRLYRPLQQCAPGEICALPQARAIYRACFWLTVMLVLLALVFPYVMPLFY